MKERKFIVDSREHNDEGVGIEPVIIREHALQIARMLYRMMVGKYPDRLIMLCDQARVLARSDRPETMPPLS